MGAGPNLGGDLDGIPRGSERRRVGQVEVGDLLDGEPAEKGGGVGVDALGGLGAEAADQLRTEEAPGDGVAGDADADRLRAGIVTLVVIRRGLRRRGPV